MAEHTKRLRIERRDKIIELREKGLTQREIATAVGVSRQRVSQVLGKYSPHLANIITKDQCVYEGLRKWMNENGVYAVEMVRILHDGRLPGGNSIKVVYSRLNGKTQFKLSEINKLLDRSGLTYEELFRSGGDGHGVCALPGMPEAEGRLPCHLRGIPGGQSAVG